MYKDRKILYQQIERLFETKVICYVTGDKPNMEIQIGSDVLEYFVEHLDRIGKTQKISLILYSRGGKTLAGWSIVNLVRQFCNEFQVIIPSKAHSTATLIALGANSIVMTKQATLGPIDPSVNSPLNPEMPGRNPFARVPISVESINGYFELVKSLGIDDGSQLTQIVLNLSNKVHPVVLGNVYRSRTQIRMLGEKLLLNHKKEKDNIEKILNFLCSESGSHDYTIYRDEAKNSLGLNIIVPNDEQYDIIKKIHVDYTKEMEMLLPFDPNLILGDDNEKEYSIIRGIIESVEGGSTKFISKGKLRRTKVPGHVPGQTHDAIEDRRLFEGWLNE